MSDYLAEMHRSIERFERAEQDFADITAECVELFGPRGEYVASKTLGRKRAQGDAAYYRDRAVMYALADLAEQGRPVVVPGVTQ